MKGRNLTPPADVTTAAAERIKVESKLMSPRKLRDAQTRAKGAVTGIPTNARQWNRWTP